MGQPVLHVKDADFQKEVLESSRPVVVAFWAPWSDPAVLFGQAVAEMALRFRSEVKVVAVNVDESAATSRQYGIAALPTLLSFSAGRVTGQIVGTTGERELEALFRQGLTHDSRNGPSQGRLPSRS